MREPVIGLEIHLQLKTKTKLFCSCSSDYIGATPNTNVCPVCLAVHETGRSAVLGRVVLCKFESTNQRGTF